MVIKMNRMIKTLLFIFWGVNFVFVKAEEQNICCSGESLHLSQHYDDSRDNQEKIQELIEAFPAATRFPGMVPSLLASFEKALKNKAEDLNKEQMLDEKKMKHLNNFYEILKNLREEVQRDFDSFSDSMKIGDRNVFEKEDKEDPQIQSVHESFTKFANCLVTFLLMKK